MQGELGLYYNYTIENVEGKIIKRKRKTKSYSFVKAFIYILSCNMGLMRGSEVNTLDTSNVSRSPVTTIARFADFDVQAAANVTTYGSVVGTGNTAVTISDYALVTKINHGTSSGQLQYGACTIATPTSDATTSSTIITRVFTNGSAGSITINEIGIYANAASGWNFCIIRDIPTPITLAVGEKLTLNYIIQAVA